MGTGNSRSLVESVESRVFCRVLSPAVGTRLAISGVRALRHRPRRRRALSRKILHTAAGLHPSLPVVLGFSLTINLNDHDFPFMRRSAFDQQVLSAVRVLGVQRSLKVGLREIAYTPGSNMEKQLQRAR